MIKLIENNKKNLERSLLFFLIALAFFILVFFIFLQHNNATSDLAWAFIHGKLNFITEIKNPDFVFFDNQLFWPTPPFPALILIPLVLFYQYPVEISIINFLVNIILFIFLTYFASKIFKFNKLDSYWLSALYFFSSVHIITLALQLDYNFAHTICTLLIFLGLYEFFNQRRYWLIGILLGCVFLTRITAIFVVLFFLAYILTDQINNSKKFKQLVMLLSPIFICFLIFGLYNFLRFNNPLQTGYVLSNAYSNVYADYHPYGQFSLKYLPQNFYYYFLESFSPIYAPAQNEERLIILKPPFFRNNPYGATSFFLIAPLFLYLFKANYRDKINKLLLITSLVILFVLLCYWYNGWPQIGPRYLNDCLPLLFVILLAYFKEKNLTFKHKIIIFSSALLNLYLSIFIGFGL
jgi:hypothetical protein